MSPVKSKTPSFGVSLVPGGTEAPETLSDELKDGLKDPLADSGVKLTSDSGGPEGGGDTPSEGGGGPFAAAQLPGVDPAKSDSKKEEEKAVKVRSPQATVTSSSIALNQSVYFDFDKDSIKPVSHPILQAAALAINNVSDTLIRIEGHTDWVGRASYNKGLSERRAKSVVEHLTTVTGVSPSRLVAKGFGESKPIASNTHAEGRSRNRRVDIERPSAMPDKDGKIVPDDPVFMPGDVPEVVPKDEPKVVPKDGPKVVPKDEPKVVPKDEPKVVPDEEPPSSSGDEVLDFSNPTR